MNAPATTNGCACGNPRTLLSKQIALIINKYKINPLF
jgi:hypothetical protein